MLRIAPRIVCPVGRRCLCYRCEGGKCVAAVWWRPADRRQAARAEGEPREASPASRPTGGLPSGVATGAQDLRVRTATGERGEPAAPGRALRSAAGRAWSEGLPRQATRRTTLRGPGRRLLQDRPCGLRRLRDETRHPRLARRGVHDAAPALCRGVGARWSHPGRRDVVPPHGVPSLAKIIDVEMLVMSDGGYERTEAEFAELFGRAGLHLARVVPNESPLEVMEAVRA